MNRPPLEMGESGREVLERRYLLRDGEGRLGETPEGLFRRVAAAVAAPEARYGEDPEAWGEVFYGLMVRGEFLPNSPTLMNAGTPLGQLAACFVLPLGDSLEEIFDALKHTALIHQSGGGTGFDFSSLRPAGDPVRRTSGVASGPLSFLELFDHATEVIRQGGRRRGANMGVLWASHPDVEAFLRAKGDPKRLRNFNLSLAVPDRFLHAVREDGPWDLIHPRTGERTRTLRARDLWNLLVDRAWSTGDPGILFADRIEEDNPTPRLGTLRATNPCGEQPLLPYESCHLGSLNLLRLADEAGEPDWERLEGAIRGAVRFLDDGIDATRYPLREIAERTRASRKIGLGVMGWADLLFRRRIRYGSPESLALAEEVMGFVQRVGHRTSEELAERKGAFPAWEGEDPARRGRRRRNATVTTLAPTGTLSLLGGCSGGIEPVFALALRRRAFEDRDLELLDPVFLRDLDALGDRGRDLLDRVRRTGTLEGAEAPEWMRSVYVTAHQVTPEEHVRTQGVFQAHTDGGVSKTVNLPHGATREQVERVFLLAHEAGCKGITVYRDRCREDQVLSPGTSWEEDRCPVCGASRIHAQGCGLCPCCGENPCP